jgi:dolichol-phosphate mannosyltransferase
MNPSTANDPLAITPRRNNFEPHEAVTDVASRKATRASGRVCVILPAYNEEQNLELLLQRIRVALDPLDYSYEVVVVNDGSKDGTAEIARRLSESMPIQLENHQQNQGLGGTLRTGFLAALKHADPNDVLVCMDADNTQPPESIPQMVEMIRNGYDLVVASRFRRGAQVIGLSPMRRMMSLGARCVFSVFHPIRGIRDYTCGFRAYRAEILKRGLEQFGDEFFSEKGFSSMADILLKLRRQPLVAGEIPLVLRYDQKSGASKMKVLGTVWATLMLVARRRLR